MQLPALRAAADARRWSVQMAKEPWFAARCIFRHRQLPAKRGASVYEERIILVRASSEDAAVAKAEKEAARYASNGSQSLGFVEVFRLFAERVGDQTEVFSLMRTSKLSPTAYLNRFWDTGAEHSKRAKGSNRARPPQPPRV